MVNILLAWVDQVVVLVSNHHIEISRPTAPSTLSTGMTSNSSTPVHKEKTIDDSAWTVVSEDSGTISLGTKAHTLPTQVDHAKS